MKTGQRIGRRRRVRRRWPARLAWLALKLVLVFIVLTVGSVAVLRYVDPPTSAFMLRDRFSTHPEEPETKVSYRWVAWDEISPQMRVAVVAAEDQKFPLHAGFDVESIRAVLAERREGTTGSGRGASTISQQLAKNLFLWPGRSWLRKGLEAYFTLLIEGLWTKRRILEVYLNVVQFGDNTYGVEAAAEGFFKKPASELSARESALLAAVLPNPVRFRVERPSDYVRQRQRWIERQMRQLGGPEYLDTL